MCMVFDSRHRLRAKNAAVNERAAVVVESPANHGSRLRQPSKNKSYSTAAIHTRIRRQCPEESAGLTTRPLWVNARPTFDYIFLFSWAREQVSPETAFPRFITSRTFETFSMLTFRPDPRDIARLKNTVVRSITYTAVGYWALVGRPSPCARRHGATPRDFPAWPPRRRREHFLP